MIKRGLFASLFFACALLFASCFSDEGKNVFEAAERLRVERKFEEAIEKYRLVMLHHAKTEFAPEAFFRTGEILYLYIYDFNAAADTFRDLLSNYPWSERCKKAQSYLADIYMYRFEDYRQAIVEYQKAIYYYGAEKESEGFRLEIAKAYFSLENFEQQRVELNLLLDKFPDTDLRGDIYYQMANSYYVEGKVDEAMEVYERVVNAFPDTPLALEATFKIATCLEEKEDLLGAMALLMKIEGVYPNNNVVRLRIEKIKKRLKLRRR